MNIGDKFATLFLFVDLPAKLFISLYRSSSQTLDDFETFFKNSELNSENIVQRNPFLVKVNQDKSTFEDNAADNITSKLGLYKVIKEPTQISDTTSSSCIYLILTSLITD